MVISGTVILIKNQISKVLVKKFDTTKTLIIAAIDTALTLVLVSRDWNWLNDETPNF